MRMVNGSEAKNISQQFTLPNANKTSTLPPGSKTSWVTTLGINYDLLTSELKIIKKFRWPIHQKGTYKTEQDDESDDSEPDFEEKKPKFQRPK